ncbi:PAP2 superfamily protein (plasmid) [Pseudosulfitobacter pseudonitzschiae]|uniref:PAP2 superfamily protein n=1 Tax=Pseudosulfitobacter pseudonitzschiae TaxID=1402135 RepID=A0A221K9B7_9RHOB|nr:MULTISPECIES: vanadium-dependent haloperoxidase [Roseobacteraceae]ASM75447.1 PAP2 superfamily protein [Pseudosulfitobacter pseudonitzschiae]
MRYDQGTKQRRRVAKLLLSALLATSALAVTHANAAAADDPAWCQPDCGDLVSDWSLNAYAVMRAANGYADPMAATRVLATMHIAMHDAANAGAARYATHTRISAPAADYDAAVATVVAAHDVLVGFFPDQAAIVAAALEASLLDAGVGAAVQAGRAVGADAAAAILAERATDGAEAREGWTEQEGVGHYRHVPGWDFLVSPQWRSVRPFALASPDQFRTAPPPALASAEYAVEFAEVAATGRDVSETRSAEETEYAAFWYEFSDIGWNRATRVAAREHDLDLRDNARLFALVNVAMADGYIAGWDSKMHHDFWRPVTAIATADDDGNPGTTSIESWAPFLPTPPIQDHPSTHSVLGAATATVLAETLGDTGFAMTSTTALGHAPWRSFEGFTDAAEENAESRIHAGIHFRSAIDTGLDLGRKIGTHVLNNFLVPVN